MEFDWEEGNVYVLIAIVRKKYSRLTKSTELVYREICKSQEDFEKKIGKLNTIIDHHPEFPSNVWGLYVTFNPRSVKKAYLLLKKQMADWDFQRDNAYLKKLSKIDKMWVSCLQKPEGCSKRKYFLLDLDDKEKFPILEKMLKEQEIIVKHVVETKNGWHLLVNPFDVRRFNVIHEAIGDDIELKKDALVKIR